MENANCNSELRNHHQDTKKTLKEELKSPITKLRKAEMLQIIQELKGENKYLSLLNKEHLLARNQTENTFRKHSELYNNAASGYFTLSRTGKIIDLNLIGWEMLGKNTFHLINTFFDSYLSEDSKSTFRNFIEQVFSVTTAITCELTFINTDNTLNYAQLTGIIAENNKNCYITAVDITERKMAEEILIKEKIRLSAIIDGSNVGTWEWNILKNQIVYDDQYLEMIGYNLEKNSPATIESWRKITHPDDLKISDEIFEKHTRGELDYYECEIRMKHKNGNWIWILDKGKINQRDKNGKPISISGTHQNITDRKTAEEFASLSKITYRGILNSISELIYIQDENGCFLDVNKATEKVYGYKREYFIGKTPEFLSAPGKNDLVSINNFIQLAWEGKTQSFEFWGITIDGRVFPKEVNLSLGTYFGKSVIIAVARDISERKYAEEKLLESENRYRVLIESSNEGVLVGQGANLKFVNSKIIELSGYTHEELLSTPFMELLHPDYRELTMSNYLKRLNDEKVDDRYEVKIVTKDKKTIWTEFSGVKIDWEGNPASMTFITDITQRKLTEEALKQSEERYRSLVELSFEAIVVHRNGIIIYANPSAINTVKTDKNKELIGIPIFDMIHPDYHQIMVEHLKKLVNVGDFTPIDEAQFFKLDGTIIDVEVQAKVINYDGEPAIQASIRDVTYKKELENNLIKVSKIARMGTWKLDLSSYKFDISGITRDILEVADNFETDLETAITIFNLEENREKIFTVIGEGIENGKKWELELNFRTAKNNDLWVKIIGETEFINGKPLRINGSFQDINDRKKAQIALYNNMKELEDYKFALDESAIIAITDENGIIKIANDNFCKISGYNREELIGNTHKIISSKFHSRAFFTEMWDTLTSGKIWRGLIKNKNKNGDYYWVDSTIVPFLDFNNKPFQYLAIRFDVTEIKIAEDEILKSKEKAEESDRLKSAFLANMSHEIRTPMNGILGFTNLLKEVNLSSKDQQEYIKIIDQSGARLLNIINDIIDISKIESNQMVVSISETNINEKIEYIYNFFKPETSKKGILLSYKNDLPTNESIISTDIEKINAVLVNLVKNAIKFCDKGTIDFGYNLKKNSDSPELEFYVKDSGVGIPYDRQKAIFDRFIQADVSDKRAFQGAGLGLSISKAYVEMLGGKIWVESEVGIGSSFYFTIPYNSIAKTETLQEKIFYEKKSEFLIKDLKILIVEDDPISKLLISKAVATFSKEIIKVSSGIQAVEACQKNPDIDLVMMDINMPDMNGYEATEQIRKFNKKVIIIAQTANAFTSDKEESIAAGCNDYISKPIDKNSLINLIQKYFK